MNTEYINFTFDFLEEKFFGLLENDRNKEAMKHFEFSIVSASWSTFVICVVPDPSTLYIPCLYGIPLDKERYNFANDTYKTRGSAYTYIGKISIGFEIKIDDYSIPIAMPDSVIGKLLDQNQKKLLRQFKNNFDSSEVRYIQLRC